MKELFWYKKIEEIEEQVGTTKVQHEDEMEIVPKFEKKQVTKLMGSFSLDAVVASTLVDENTLEVYLNLTFQQAVPNPNKPVYEMRGEQVKNVNGKIKRFGGTKVQVGYEYDPIIMPMCHTLTVKEDIERFLELTGGKNV